MGDAAVKPHRQNAKKSLDTKDTKDTKENQELN